MGTRLLLSAAAVVEGRKLRQEDLGERVVFRHSLLWKSNSRKKKVLSGLELASNLYVQRPSFHTKLISP